MGKNSVTVTTIKLEDHFKDVIDSVGKETLEKAALAAGHVVEAYAKINVNENFSSKSTGGAGLAGSIHTVLSESDDNHAVVDVGSGLVYSRMREFGGIIKPVFKTWLHWVEDGKDVFAKLVHQEGKPWLRPAVDEHLPEIEAAAGEQIKQAIERSLK